MNLIRRFNFYFVDLAEQGIEQAYAVRVKCLPSAKLLSLWHHRLGHINLKSVEALEELATGVRIDKNGDETELAERDRPCKLCIHGKAVKKPLKGKGKSEHPSEMQFDLIHSDLCGPLPEAHDGSCYFVTFVDNFTQGIFARRLVKKNQTFCIFKNFHALVKTQFNTLIKRL